MNSQINVQNPDSILIEIPIDEARKLASSLQYLHTMLKTLEKYLKFSFEYSFIEDIEITLFDACNLQDNYNEQIDIAMEREKEVKS